MKAFGSERWARFWRRCGFCGGPGGDAVGGGGSGVLAGDGATGRGKNTEQIDAFQKQIGSLRWAWRDRSVATFLFKGGHAGFAACRAHCFASGKPIDTKIKPLDGLQQLCSDNWRQPKWDIHASFREVWIPAPNHSIATKIRPYKYRLWVGWGQFLRGKCSEIFLGEISFKACNFLWQDFFQGALFLQEATASRMGAGRPPLGLRTIGRGPIPWLWGGAGLSCTFVLKTICYTYFLSRICSYKHAHPSVHQIIQTPPALWFDELLGISTTHQQLTFFCETPGPTCIPPHPQFC